MGKSTGFLEYKRELNPSADPKERIKNFNEFHKQLPGEERRLQGARCMNCGVPFCQSGELFGGMFRYEPMHGIVKSILTVGTLLVCLQADRWLRRDDTRHKQGEFYLLTFSTPLGMFFMIGAGNFLMFFLGLELASVPTACLVAFDKYKHHSRPEPNTSSVRCSPAD